MTSLPEMGLFLNTSFQQRKSEEFDKHLNFLLFSKSGKIRHHWTLVPKCSALLELCFEIRWHCGTASGVPSERRLASCVADRSGAGDSPVSHHHGPRRTF